MSFSAASFFDLDIRSYNASWDLDRHAFAQLVLPLDGEVHLDIAGRQGRADPLHAAVVVEGTWHATRSEGKNRSLILDFDQAELELPHRQRLLERPFAVLGPAARKLIEFMQLMTEQRAINGALLRGWTPMLLDTLAMGAPQPRSRLAALLAQVAASPGAPWTTESMAQAAHLSVSRLHAVFSEEMQTSPHRLLLQQRLDCACQQLAGGQLAVAQIALNAGFSDQSALTRAMRQQRGTTPAAYRRRSQETASNIR
jgi:AraC-like DNA-binding protein